MIDLTDRNRAAFLLAGATFGYPNEDVPLPLIARRLGWPVADTIVFAWDGHGRYWDTDGGLGSAPTVLEAP